MGGLTCLLWPPVQEPPGATGAEFYMSRDLLQQEEEEQEVQKKEEEEQKEEKVSSFQSFFI